MFMEAPIKTVTPYGGRLTWRLPGRTKLVVHMKDKTKIRHKKRWSQVSVKSSPFVYLSQNYSSLPPRLADKCIPKMLEVVYMPDTVKAVSHIHVIAYKWYKW